MRPLLPCLLNLSLVLVCGAVVDDPYAVDHVLVVSASNFDDVVLTKDLIAVEFFAPWCGHCKKLEPEWRAAAETLQSHEPPVHLAKVDATAAENKALVERFGITGFPAIKLFKKGGGHVGPYPVPPAEYKGPRKAKGIVDYMTKLTLPSTVEITTEKGAKEWLTKGRNLLVGLFEEDSAESRAFARVADELKMDETARFALAAHEYRDSLLASKYEVPSVVLFRSGWWIGEDKEVHLVGKGGKGKGKQLDLLAMVQAKNGLERMRRLLKLYSIPSITQLNLHIPAMVKATRSFVALAEPVKYKVVLVADTPDDQVLLAKYAAPLQALAAAHAPGSVACACYTFKSPSALALERALKLDGLLRRHTLPAVMVQDVSKGVRYLGSLVSNSSSSSATDDGPARYATVDSFFEHAIANNGSVSPHVRSQSVALAADNPHKDVKVVVASNFEELVLGGSHNVLLQVYAPWCAHCKKFAPIYERLGRVYAAEKRVMIAKIDGTENDLPLQLQPQLKGFPTLLWFSGKPGTQGRKSVEGVEVYTGKRDGQALIEWIQTHSSYGVKVQNIADDSSQQFSGRSAGAKGNSIASKLQVLVGQVEAMWARDELQLFGARFKFSHVLAVYVLVVVVVLATVLLLPSGFGGGTGEVGDKKII